VEIYSTKDATGQHLTIHKEPVARGPAYFVDVSTPSGDGLCCALSATSAFNLARVLVWSAHADALEPAPEMRPPIPPMLRAVD
jgi:hypothetical protein